MARKSVKMLRVGKHAVIVQGHAYEILRIDESDGSYTIDLGDGGVLHRTANAKVEIR